MNKSVTVALAILLLVLLIPLIGLPVSSLLKPNPPLPEITYGEFPFRIEYEINGDRVVVEDTVICEFDGFGFSWGGEGKFRKWKSHLLNSEGAGSFLLLLETVDAKLYCTVRSPAYYMGDSKSFPNEIFPPSAFTKKTKSYNFISSQELFDRYGIRFISWEFSPPIENNFG